MQRHIRHFTLACRDLDSLLSEQLCGLAAPLPKALVADVCVVASSNSSSLHAKVVPGRATVPKKLKQKKFAKFI
ncbi:hypothetical protein GUJ93_ZPchr0009g2065 [Zizania palustris]|uniref:Uncharacterized protein n=1 Tax=Zizania palustris TaxID=103762 RepID=A0A8J5RL71_ZIZPA|nr:hypothetical protein GUJ93_ZPchr0009g2065 [Zizania palustris]